MWGYLKRINNNYSNIIQAFATLVLVIVTIVYVVVSCQTLSVVKKDFQARTEPEIQIIAPVQKKIVYEKQEFIGTQYMLINTGFQARDVKVRTILYRDQEPVELLPALFQFKGMDEKAYARDVIPVLGENVVLLSSAYNYTESRDMGLLIIVNYYSPIKESRKIECSYFNWNPFHKSWRPSSKEVRDQMLEKGKKSEFLHGIIDNNTKTRPSCQ